MGDSVSGSPKKIEIIIIIFLIFMLKWIFKLMWVYDSDEISYWNFIFFILTLLNPYNSKLTFLEIC